jgi:transposase
VKLHLTLDHAGYLPEAMVITTGNYSELTVAQRQRYARGTILVMDRGFVHFRWFAQLNTGGVFFVTRMKDHLSYEVIEDRATVKDKGIVSDQHIRWTSKQSRNRYPDKLRLVIIKTDKGEQLEFLTNHMTLAASTIAEIYKDRWQIETFFKLLKQNLRIKTFIGTSVNAVWIQIWTALIAMLLIKFLQLKARFGWSFSNLTYFLRMNLLVYRDLWDWLHSPFTAPPEPDPPEQLDFRAALIGTAE